MATAISLKPTDWRQEWFEFEDAAYLNAAGQAPMPKVSLRAVQAALEWKKFPHKMPDSAYFETPNRVRASIAKLIGGKPEEVALTTGASGGLAAVAYGVSWKPGDEIITAKGEFPAQFTAWKPLEAREGVRLRVVAPRERFLTADDLIAALTPKTRLVSVSLVRFDDASRLDASRTAAACHAQGTYLLLDISQCCGATSLDMRKLGADFLVCAGYKWILSPYGTGFFWARPETVAEHNRALIEMMYERLPRDRCIATSPLDPARRGPYGCFAARTPEKTAALYERLRKENVIVSLREGNLRVSPYLYNTERDIDRLIAVATI